VTQMQFAHLEFEAQRCDPAMIAASIRGSGCAVIRNVLPAHITSYLADVLPFLFSFVGLNETYSKYDAATATEPVARLEPPLLRFDVLPAYSSMVELDPVGSLYKGVDRSLLPLIAKTYFGGRDVRIESGRSLVRRQSPKHLMHALPFHQDGANYSDHPFLNFWLPITLAGGDMPGIELAPVGLTACMALTKEQTDHPLIELDAAEIIQRFGSDSFFRPVMAPGDVLVMNEYTIHRTHIPTQAVRDRYSIELRVAAVDEDDI
jgi:hypothetical protein